MSNQSLQYIYFCGTNVDLESALEEYFIKLTNKNIKYEVIFVKTEEELLESISNSLPSILIVDYCHFEETQFTPTLIKTIHGHSAFSKSPIAAVLSSEIQCKESEFLFGFGFSMFHVLGNDIRQFLNNLFYTNYEVEPNNSKYAMAKGFELDFKMNSLGFVSHFDNVSLNFDTDINCGSEASIQAHFTEDFPALDYPIIESFSRGKDHLTYYHEKVKIPFASGWDTEDENALFQDTHESWIATNKENFITDAIDIIFYSKSVESIGIVNQLTDKDTNVLFNYSYDESKKELYKCRADLIIFEITDEDSHSELHNIISDISFNPSFRNTYILIFNHTSHTNAIRKMYDYENLIATNTSPSIKILTQMVNSLREKVNKDTYQFRSTDPRRCVNYLVDVKITSITENELTFKTKTEIPCYSILTIDVPIKMYLITIPAKIQLSPFPDGYHYQCLINGIDSHSSEYLRKYVNRLLGKTPENWTHIDFSTNASQEKQKGPQQQNIENKEEEIEAKKNNIIDLSDIETTERSKSKNLKSKL